MENPNDVIVRLTKDAEGKISHEVLLGVSDEDMIPHLNVVAENINQLLNMNAAKVICQG